MAIHDTECPSWDQVFLLLLLLSSFFLISGKPSPPVNLHSKAKYIHFVHLAWDEPKSDGGARIKGYIVETRTEKETHTEKELPWKEVKYFLKYIHGE